MKSWRRQLPALAERVRAERAELEHRAADIQSMTETLEDTLDLIARSWSGSPLGYHSRLYFENFGEPTFQQAFDSEWGRIHGIPSYWVEQTPESVKEAMESHASITMEELETAAATLRSKVMALHTDTCIALAPMRNQPGFEREVALLDELEALEFERSSRAIAHALAPKQQMTRDSFAANQGIQIPAHILLRARMLAARSTARATTDFLTKADRLIRQSQTQLASVGLSDRVRRSLGKVRWLGKLAGHPYAVEIVGGSVAALVGVVLTLWLVV